MLCLLETYNLHCIVDLTTTRSRALSPEMEKQYNSLVKGWIFASISEELLGTVVNLDSAKAVWDKLKSFYDPVLISSQQAQTNKEAETDTETETRGLDKGEIPLDRAYEYLLKVDKGARIPKRRSAPSEGSFHRSGKFGDILLVNAIYAKNFALITTQLAITSIQFFLTPFLLATARLLYKHLPLVCRLRCIKKFPRTKYCSTFEGQRRPGSAHLFGRHFGFLVTTRIIGISGDAFSGDSHL
ncbi:unnamed protein product [Lactuca saligna]|uniref:Uncharacterized protein n=1 Tax=Lactuca saligna TaxID=75948 RepID=A0AA35ZJ31_LACSI|nr:unnamed protein product [Lactuca saligna]